MNKSTPTDPPRRLRAIGLRFSLQALLTVICLLSVLFAWWRDHRHLLLQLELQQSRVQAFETLVREWDRIGRRSGFGGGGFGGSTEEVELAGRFATLQDYLGFVHTSRDASKVERSFGMLNQSPWKIEAIPDLLHMLKSTDAEQRRRAIYAFNYLDTNNDQIVAQLANLLDDPVPEVQHLAVSAIGEHGQSATAAVAALRRQADSKTSPIATESLLTLIAITRETDIEAGLLRLLHHDVEQVRRQAVQAIPKHVAPGQAEEALQALFFRESADSVKSAVAAALNEVRLVRPTGDENDKR